jgi:hypothetical protein
MSDTPNEREQVAAVSVPIAHDDVPEAVYPALHVGLQVLPDASVLVQVPTAPLVGAVDASHVLGSQVAAISLPAAVHEDVPETVYPALHAGLQVLPDASVLVQVPAAPLAGAAAASHGLAAHVAAISLPAAVHEDVPETVYPESHVGLQVLPVFSVLVQSPTTPLAGAVAALHGHPLTVKYGLVAVAVTAPQ